MKRKEGKAMIPGKQTSAFRGDKSTDTTRKEQMWDAKKTEESREGGEGGEEDKTWLVS